MTLQPAIFTILNLSDFILIKIRCFFKSWGEYGLADFRSDNKVKRKKNFLPEVKSLVNLFKGCGCGQRPQIVFFYTMSDSQMACRLRLEYNGESLLIA